MTASPAEPGAAGPTGGPRAVRERVVFVVNTDSGGWRQGARERLQRAASAIGGRLDLRAVSAREVEDALRDACAERPDVVGVAGGDGTLRTAAGLAIAQDATLAIVPLGTMNLLASDLGVAASLERAVGAAFAGREARIDVGRVNGRVFLHSSILGVVPRLGRHRETMRQDADPRNLPGRLFEAARAAATTPKLPLSIEADGATRDVRTFALAVTNNPLRGELLDPYGRSRLDAGLLGVYRSAHRGRLGLARLLASLGAGMWWFDDHFHVSQAASIRVHSRRERLEVSSDGEIERLTPPLTFEVQPRALRVVTTRPPGELA